MGSRLVYEGVCPKCGWSMDILCTSENLPDRLAKEQCGECHHIGLKRSWMFGSYKMKTGATRSGTK